MGNALHWLRKPHGNQASPCAELGMGDRNVTQPAGRTDEREGPFPQESPGNPSSLSMF